MALGCRCDPKQNGHGEGMRGIVAILGEDGVARKADGPVYLVEPGCLLHDPEEADDGARLGAGRREQ